MEIGKKIKQLRLEKGMSQQELANKLGYSRERINQIENAKHDIGITSALRVLDVLGYEFSIMEKQSS